MTPESFVDKLRCSVIEHAGEAVKSLFSTTAPESATDPYWRQALTLFNSLSESERRILFEIMHQVRVDTVSECLGILDGVCAIEGPREDFVLTTPADGQTLSGDLQELFLERDESLRRSSGDGGG